MTSLKATLRQAFSQINRNKMMTTASLFSITAILLVLGIFFVVIVNINSMSQDIKRDFDQIQVNLYDSVTAEQSADMMNQINAMQGVADVAYQTRETALENWKEKWGENADLLDRMPTNPLPNAILINLTDIAYAKTIVAAVSKINGIENISYSQDTVDKLLRLTRMIQIVSLVVIIVLVAISITVVSNTIKLTVLAREREIVIMRYIGATNWFIRGPFLLEGIVIGVIAAVISAAAIGFLYYYAVGHLGVDFALLMPTGFVPLPFLIENLFIIFVALGVSIGACGSIISMRRFLGR
ncbi:MAG: permease-like cell division protein FtsX [Clostridiales Family XIII bacterium]|jgi:cell division transport system permease protein|nr:permease-like cell division protein FtsX [Clostridiales Family XIII bacterium]